MTTWEQGILGTIIAALIIALITAMVAAIRRGVRGLAENTAAIREFRAGMASLQLELKDMRSETKQADQQISARVADLETWRTAVTASLFRFVGSSSEN